MIPLVALLALQQGILTDPYAILPGPDGKNGPYRIIQPQDRRKGGPKLSPLRFGDPPHPFEFDWVTGAYGAPLDDPEALMLKFRVYSQDAQKPEGPGWNVARMLLRLWTIVRQEYATDHKDLYGGGIVDVYLCNEGKAGGEQRFDVDTQPKPPMKVSTIYIYDLPSFTDPVEMAREVAHEYGHAILWPVGGFKYPEEWANGYLGEKIFLRRIAREMEFGHLASVDAMGADQAKLRAWVRKNVDPVVDAIALKGPRPDLAKTSGKVAMDAYLGTALWVEEAFGSTVYARSAKMNAEANVRGYLDTVQLAVQEPDRVEINVPVRLAGKPFFLPIATGRIEGAKVLYKKDGWAKLQPTGGPIVLVNR